MKATSILSALISLLLVRGVIGYFGYHIGIVILLVIAGVIWLVAGKLERIAYVMRETVKELQRRKGE